MGRILSFENSEEKQKMISEYYYFLYLIKDVKILMEKYRVDITNCPYYLIHCRDSIILFEQMTSLSQYDVDLIMKWSKVVWGINLGLGYNSFYDLLHCPLFYRISYKDIVKDCNHYIECHLLK